MAPPCFTEPGFGVSATVATGRGATATCTDEVTPSLSAVICAEPSATPVTRPLDDTEVIAELDVVQFTGRPVRMVPPASRVVADSWSVSPWKTVCEPAG